MAVMQGVLTTREEFLFPDSCCAPLPESARVVMAKNGRPGIQLLFKTAGNSAELRFHSQEFQVEWYQMVSIPVEYNTGNGEEQEGAMVILPEEKPAYAIRKAPFRVFDCLKPVDGVTEAENGQCSIYLCLELKEGLGAGDYAAVLEVKADEGTYECRLEIRVYDVEIPENHFQVTNWFSLESIRRFHKVEDGTKEYYQMVEKYARAMRRARQTMFYLELDQTCVATRKPYSFDFSYLKPLIELFFASGMERLEIGPLLSRGFLEDGMPDMYTSSFCCAMVPDVKLESMEGYEITSLFVKTLAGFLEENGWEEKVVFHIHDEPDVHIKDRQGMEDRKRQYFQAVCILKKYLPGVKVIEAVKTTEFRGGVDIWTPVTSSFEEHKQDYLKMMELGEEVWNYVCCVPQGKWLNRFLDDALIHSRLMFWGYEKYGVSGYLHWGFNIFQMGMNPYEASSCPNHTGIGTNFPCGDAFIVYPGEDGPYIGMRLEAQRRGAEDVELLSLLGRKNPKLHEELVGRVFENHYTYVDDPEVFAECYERLLSGLEEK